MPAVNCLSQPGVMALFLEHSPLYVRPFEILLFSVGMLYSIHERVLWKPFQSQAQNIARISVILTSYFSENFPVSWKRREKQSANCSQLPEQCYFYLKRWRPWPKWARLFLFEQLPLSSSLIISHSPWVNLLCNPIYCFSHLRTSDKCNYFLR